MQSKYIKETVAENIEISNNIFKLTVKGNLKGNPGQFYMLRTWKMEPFLSRPISINYRDDNEISFLYEVRGEGTKLFSKLKHGDEIELLGPLGNGFKTEEITGRVAVLTGGIGIAPMYYTIKSLMKLRKCEIDLYAGFREDVYLVDDLQKHVENVYISTDNGIKGHKGYITEIFEPKNYDIVLCCGPEIMMNKVIRSCNEVNVPVYVSMEKHMACGVGACLGCTCKTVEGNKRTCKEGPVFSGKEVVIDA